MYNNMYNEKFSLGQWKTLNKKFFSYQQLSSRKVNEFSMNLSSLVRFEEYM